jgi:hypothetical protein
MTLPVMSISGMSWAWAMLKMATQAQSVCHADVQAMVATFNVIDGELGEQVGDVRRC